METVKKDNEYLDARESFSSCVDNLKHKKVNLLVTSKNDRTEIIGQEFTANSPRLSTKTHSLTASEPDEFITDKLSQLESDQKPVGLETFYQMNLNQMVKDNDIPLIACKMSN